MARRSEKAAESPVIFDTDVLIWYFRGNSASQHLLQRQPKDFRWASSVTLMELMQGSRTRAEMNDIQAFVFSNLSKIIHPETAISEKAIQLIDQFAMNKGLRVADALIGASALMQRARLATGNTKHFEFIPGLDLVAFKPS